MTILAAVNAAERRRRDVDALTAVVHDAQRRVADVQSMMSTRAMMSVQEQVAALAEPMRMFAERANLATTAAQRIGEQLAAQMAPFQQMQTDLATGMRMLAEPVGASKTAAHQIGEQLAASVGPLHRMQTDFAAFARPLLEATAVTNTVVASLHRHLHAGFGFSETLGLSIADFARHLEQTTDRHIAGRLLGRGWLGIERHLSTGELVKVVQVRSRTKGRRRVTGAEIDKRICAHFRRKAAVRLREMTRAWKPISYLDERRRIIQEALSAHVDRKYSLSIAALLPLVDGLADEIRRTAIKPVKGKKLKLIAVNEVVHLYRPADGRSRKWAEVVSIAVTEGIFKDYDFNTQPAPAKNNRHGVLHGRIPNYESEKLSLQTFLLLDVMAFIAAKHP